MEYEKIIENEVILEENGNMVYKKESNILQKNCDPSVNNTLIHKDINCKKNNDNKTLIYIFLFLLLLIFLLAGIFLFYYSWLNVNMLNIFIFAFIFLILFLLIIWAIYQSSCKKETDLC